MKVLLVSNTFTWKLLLAIWKKTPQIRILSSEGDSLIKPTKVLVLNHGPLAVPLSLSAFCICPLWSSTKMQFLQKLSLEFNLKCKQVQSLAGFLPSVYFLCCSTSLSCCQNCSRMRRRSSVPHQQPLRGACLCLECLSNLPRPGQARPARSIRKLWDIRWVWRRRSIK